MDKEASRGAPLLSASTIRSERSSDTTFSLLYPQRTAVEGGNPQASSLAAASSTARGKPQHVVSTTKKASHAVYCAYCRKTEDPLQHYNETGHYPSFGASTAASQNSNKAQHVVGHGRPQPQATATTGAHHYHQHWEHKSNEFWRTTTAPLSAEDFSRLGTYGVAVSAALSPVEHVVGDVSRVSASPENAAFYQVQRPAPNATSDGAVLDSQIAQKTDGTPRGVTVIDICERGAERAAALAAETPKRSEEDVSVLAKAILSSLGSGANQEEDPPDDALKLPRATESTSAAASLLTAVSLSRVDAQEQRRRRTVLTDESSQRQHVVLLEWQAHEQLVRVLSAQREAATKALEMLSEEFDRLESDEATERSNFEAQEILERSMVEAIGSSGNRHTPSNVTPPRRSPEHQRRGQGASTQVEAMASLSLQWVQSSEVTQRVQIVTQQQELREALMQREAAGWEAAAAATERTASVSEAEERAACMQVMLNTEVSARQMALVMEEAERCMLEQTVLETQQALQRTRAQKIAQKTIARTGDDHHAVQLSCDPQLEAARRDHLSALESTSRMGVTTTECTAREQLKADEDHDKVSILWAEIKYEELQTRADLITEEALQRRDVLVSMTSDLQSRVVHESEKQRSITQKQPDQPQGQARVAEKAQGQTQGPAAPVAEKAQGQQGPAEKAQDRAQPAAPAAEKAQDRAQGPAAPVAEKAQGQQGPAEKAQDRAQPAAPAAEKVQGQTQEPVAPVAEKAQDRAQPAAPAAEKVQGQTQEPAAPVAEKAQDRAQGPAAPVAEKAQGQQGPAEKAQDRAQPAAPAAEKVQGQTQEPVAPVAEKAQDRAQPAAPAAEKVQGQTQEPAAPVAEKAQDRAQGPAAPVAEKAQGQQGPAEKAQDRAQPAAPAAEKAQGQTQGPVAPVAEKAQDRAQGPVAPVAEKAQDRAQGPAGPAAEEAQGQQGPAEKAQDRAQGPAAPGAEKAQDQQGPAEKVQDRAQGPAAPEKSQESELGQRHFPSSRPEASCAPGAAPSTPTSRARTGDAPCPISPAVEDQTKVQVSSDGTPSQRYKPPPQNRPARGYVARIQCCRVPAQNPPT